MSQRIKVVLGLLVATIIMFVVLLVNGSISLPDQSNSTTNFDAPIDVTLDFYENWFSVRSSSTDITNFTLSANEVIAPDFYSSLEAVTSVTEMDSLLCLTEDIDSVVAKVVFQTADAAEMLVFTRNVEIPSQAIVSLGLEKDGWLITKVNCSNGDVPPPVGEFTYEQEGNLILEGLSEPFDTSRWHLFYFGDVEPGSLIPLYFGTDSVCMNPDGSTNVCATDQFTERQQVTIKGQMTEAGVQVEVVEI